MSITTGGTPYHNIGGPKFNLLWWLNSASLAQQLGYAFNVMFTSWYNINQRNNDITQKLTEYI